MKKENKVVVILLISIFVVLLIGIIFIPNYNSKSKLELELLDLSEEFYTDYYYKQLTNAYDTEELKKFLSLYIETGIKIDLESLSEYDSQKRDFKLLTNKYTDKNSKKKCDVKNTYILFFPKNPFEKNNHTTKVVLDCEFLKEK